LFKKSKDPLQYAFFVLDTTIVEFCMNVCIVDCNEYKYYERYCGDILRRKIENSDIKF
jgi:hypothetical protein